jgi:hypothetical protein
MGTDSYTGVTVTGAPAGKVEKLPDFYRINGDGWDTVPDYDVETRTFIPCETSGHCNGVGRYDDLVRAEKWARKYTRKHPGCTVEITQEWNEGEPGQSDDVYRNGELVPGGVQGERDGAAGAVPAARGGPGKALATTDPGAKHDALKALVEGLS